MIRSAAFAMRCPSCKGEVDDRDWLCPYCEHILDPSVLGLEEKEQEGSAIREERTKLVAWDPRPQEPHPEEPPEAMILGDVNVSGREFSVVQGPGAQAGGRTSTFLFYTAGATSRIVHPDAVPALTEKDSTIPHTPYEHFILSCIDGKRSVRAIQKTSGLAVQEVVITILTLLDKGVIRVDVEPVPAPLPAVKPKRELISEDDPDDDEEQEEKDDATEDGYTPEPLPRMIEDLPSIRDFEEIPPEKPDAREELFSKPLDQAPAIDADRLVEEEEDEEEAPGLVVPQELDATDSEMITDHSAPAIPMPKIEVKEPKAPTPKPVVAPRKEQTPKPLLLDPEFLVEVPKSEKSQKKIVLPPAPGREVSKDPRKTLEQATKARVPIEERDRRKADAPAPPAKKGPTSSPSQVVQVQVQVPLAKVDPVKTEAAPEPASSKKGTKAEPVGGVRMSKAAKLFDEALKDKKEGNFVSARMNMKLALTFDPSNELYQQAFDELVKGAGANAVPSKMKSRARELYDSATRAEEQGDVDEAIDLLEKALLESKESAYYNRLGVLLAMKKKEFQRAQDLIETALKISPGNSTYQHNLGKVLSMAATHDVDALKKGGKKSGILGFLGRKK